MTPEVVVIRTDHEREGRSLGANDPARDRGVHEAVTRLGRVMDSQVSARFCHSPRKNYDRNTLSGDHPERFVSRRLNG